MEAFQITLIIAFVLAACELLTGAFVMLGLGFGALVVAAVQWLGGGLHVNRDLLIFAISAAAAFVAFRKLFRRKDDQQDSATDVNRY